MAGLAALGLSACDAGAPRVSTGGIGIGTEKGPEGQLDGGTPTDAASSGDAASNNPDLAMQQSNPDLAMQQSSCSGAYDAGLASAISAGQAQLISSLDLFLCRDSGGLYAMSSLCTHSQCTLTKESTQFYCQCHGATFDLNGGQPTSPAHHALVHYALCVDANGHVQIDTSTTVAATTRA